MLEIGILQGFVGHTGKRVIVGQGDETGECAPPSSGPGHAFPVLSDATGEPWRKPLMAPPTQVHTVQAHRTDTQRTGTQHRHTTRVHTGQVHSTVTQHRHTAQVHTGEEHTGQAHAGGASGEVSSVGTWLQVSKTLSS